MTVIANDISQSISLKEIGLRKVFGSTRRQLIIQFITVALLLTFIAAIVSFVLYELLREETQVCKSILKGTNFKIKIYGESHVILDDVSLAQLQATLYGESTLEIKSGTIKDQRYIAYGENSVHGFAINNNTTKITVY